MVNKFVVDTVEAPAPTLGNTLHSWHRVSISYNNINATFIDKHVAQKDKFYWTYDIISVDEIKPVLNYIFTKLGTGPKSNKFSVNSWTVDRGFVTKNCYVGADIEIKVISSWNGVPQLVSLEIVWVQIEGKRTIT